MVDKSDVQISRVLSGIRPTGKLHLGHYAGALIPWLEAQEIEYVPECFFLIADYQGGTTHSDGQKIQEAIRDVALDMLSVGLDPERSHVHFVLQSEVQGRADMSLYFDLLASYNEILDNPTVKSELEVLKKRKVRTSMSFVRYPVDQVADICMVAPPDLPGNELIVPVGEDQDPNLEESRNLARLANIRCGQPLFRPCRAKGSEVRRLLGTDGDAKMSKSLGNTVNLTEPYESMVRKIKKMPIDPARSESANAPGDPDKTLAFQYLRAFDPDKDGLADVEFEYRLGNVGDGEVKDRLIAVLKDMLEPIQERRRLYEDNDLYVEYLIEGTKRASELCLPLAEEMKYAMGLGFPKLL